MGCCCYEGRGWARGGGTINGYSECGTEGVERLKERKKDDINPGKRKRKKEKKDPKKNPGKWEIKKKGRRQRGREMMVKPVQKDKSSTMGKQKYDEAKEKKGENDKNKK